MLFRSAPDVILSALHQLGLPLDVEREIAKLVRTAGAAVARAEAATRTADEASRAAKAAAETARVAVEELREQVAELAAERDALAFRCAMLEGAALTETGWS